MRAKGQYAYLGQTPTRNLDDIRRDKCQKKLFKAHKVVVLLNSIFAGDARHTLLTAVASLLHLAFWHLYVLGILLSMVKSPSAARFVPKCGLILFQDRGGTPVLDELGDNGPKRAKMKMPHHRVAANGNSTERRGTSWRSMLIMLFKLVVTLEDVLKVWSSERVKSEWKRRRRKGSAGGRRRSENRR